MIDDLRTNDEARLQGAIENPIILRGLLRDISNEVVRLRALAGAGGGVRPDSWIRERATAGMIEPFEAGQVRFAHCRFAGGRIATRKMPFMTHGPSACCPRLTAAMRR